MVVTCAMSRSELWGHAPGWGLQSCSVPCSSAPGLCPLFPLAVLSWTWWDGGVPLYGLGLLNCGVLQVMAPSCVGGQGLDSSASRTQSVRQPIDGRCPETLRLLLRRALPSCYVGYSLTVIKSHITFHTVANPPRRCAGPCCRSPGRDAAPSAGTGAAPRGTARRPSCPLGRITLLPAQAGHCLLPGDGSVPGAVTSSRRPGQRGRASARGRTWALQPALGCPQ